MITKKIISYLDYMIPLENASSWDNCGIQTPIYSEIISNLTIVLDVTFETIQYCIDEDINFIISHHPIFLNEKHKRNVYNYKLLKLLDENKIMVYSAHTNLDNKEKGLNEYIIHKLGYEVVKKITPEVGVIFHVENLTIEELAKKINDKFNIDTTYYKNNMKTISKVGFCSGSADKLYNEAIMNECDVFITGDIGYHTKLESKELNFNLIDISHEIEKEAVNYLHALINKYKQ